jgi:thiol-disulfide isomerase/thioredoxin
MAGRSRRLAAVQPVTLALSILVVLFVVAAVAVTLAARRHSSWRTRPAMGLGLALAIAAAASLALLAAGPGRREQIAGFLGVPAHARDLSGPQSALVGAPQWLNTPPLRAQDLRGKVVLVNFWTYSCINSLRALPYVRAWAAKYKDRGLVVIGVHTPEFAFETDKANVRRATAALGVGYPVVLDSDYAIWRAFDNQAWPAFYFIGADGRVRLQVLGEGGYDRSERFIQKLLSEARTTPVASDIAAVDGQGPEAAPDLADLRSGETYVGYAKASNFSSPGGLGENAPRLYRPATSLPLNHWNLTGVWTVGGESAALDDASGSIAFRFHARDLNLVLAPGAQGHAVRFRVTIDGAAPGADHGADVDAAGRGTVQDPRMYQLVRQSRPVEDRTFAIQFLDPGVRAYVFTFG